MIKKNLYKVDLKKLNNVTNFSNKYIFFINYMSYISYQVLKSNVLYFYNNIIINNFKNQNV